MSAPGRQTKPRASAGQSQHRDADWASESLAAGRALPPSPGFPAVTQAAARGHRPLTLGYDLGCLLLGGADAGGEGEAAVAEQLG